RAQERGGGTWRIARAVTVRAVAFFLLCAVLVAPWFFIMLRTFGTPFYNAGEEGISRIHDWYAFLNGRPWYTYAAAIPIMMPLCTWERGVVAHPSPRSSRDVGPLPGRLSWYFDAPRCRGSSVWSWSRFSSRVDPGKKGFGRLKRRWSPARRAHPRSSQVRQS